MSTSVLAKLNAQVWQSDARTITLPGGSVVAIPQRPDGMKDEWIAFLVD